MYLKRVKVRNFKSFAGSTEIPFEPGFTGVAGPNGMGKSNISDAILFVLGPTSSKALRADRLTHLFFNGGSSKKAATECEVSLTFDNKDHLLPVESGEVEVTRYVKLAPSDPNGYYSYFYVNGRRSTQTEIDSLLSHARLSGDGYNLVQQGDVNKIVAMGPIPRRGLVERLAGISQYDDELQRAETKRADLETNLGRINTLLTEIRNHLGQLESQRLAAIQYRQIQEEKRKSEARLARAGHRVARQELTSCEAQLTKLNEELGTARTEMTGLEAERQKLEASIEQLEGEIVKRGGIEAAKFKADLDAKRMAFARLDENVRTAEQALTELDARLTALVDQVRADTKELARLGSEEKRLAGQLDTVEKAAESHTADLKAATGEVEQSQGKLAGTRKQILLLQQQQEEHEKHWQSVVRDQESAKAELEGAERTKAQAEDDQRTRELELKDIELRTRPGRNDKEGGSAATPELQKHLFQLKAKERSLTTESERLVQEVTELNRRYMALDARLKARTEGGGRPNALAAVDFLLSQRNLGRIAGIRGTVEELARFDPENQTALQIAAGGRFQALVVETDQVAEECIKLLRSEKRGRATFLPLNKMLTGRPHGKSLVAAQSDGAVGFAIDLVHFDEEMRPAFWFVFGETVVMRDLAAARSQMGGVRLVTQSGDLIEATGAMTGGFVETGNRSADNAVELKRIGEELREKSGAEAAARAELGKLTVELRALTEELAKRSGLVEAQTSTRHLLDQELAGARERLKEATRRIADAEKVRGKAEADLETASGVATRLSKEIAETKASLQKLQEQYLGHLPGSVSTRIRALQETVQAKAEERLAIAKELEGIRASLTAARQAAEGHQNELGLAKKSRTEKGGALESTRTARDQAKESLEALRTVENQQLEAVKGLSEKKRVFEESRLKIVDRRARAEETIRGKETMVHQEEIRRAEAEHHLQEVEAALQDLPEEEPDAKPVPVDELKRTIATLTAQLEGMGSVNLRALEEYDSEKTRLDEFQGEVSRLGTEKQELTSLVGEIEKQKRERLTQVVLSVDKGFREIYSELSGGGEGEIALENPADPLAGGLLIKARPVGKIIQRLEQLSGGEKSLASLAFIFALQRHDPSPLYVFDEVDMSLDGVNAENVGRMLRRNAERAQFVVISLRKVTLKFAHRLFGVTMHGDGCSRVVSLKLDEIVDVDERERAEARPVLTPGAA
jgi:chromosome segregation protein